MSEHILIVTSVFQPEPIVSAQTSAQIAEALLKGNHTVRVITGYPNRPRGELYPGYHRHLFEKNIISGHYSIIRCFSIFSKSSTTLSRFLENISFGFSSGLALIFSKKPDVIYANTWPIFATGIVRWIASLRKIPLVISIQDVYPESLLSQSRLKAGDRVYKILLDLDRWIAQGCQCIISISDRFARIYCEQRGIPPNRIKVIPNWMDKNIVTPGSKLEYRKEKGISENAFVLVFGGNIGVAAGVEIFIQAFKEIKLDCELIFIIAGSGSQLAVCQKLALEITNVKILFHTPWASEDMSKVLAAADILVLSTFGSQSLVSIPSKFISYLLAARPVLALSLPESEITKIILERDCGWVVEPDNPEILALMIEKLVYLPGHLLDQKGLAGRNYALQNLVSEVCLPKVIDVIEAAAK
ncbi:MAG: glycosyltransferase family 4 protein [Anaerolineaceae bacterium]|nr:glycosyltransferase family 4 protein [Anaerolineaceae bacterium]